MPSPVVASGHSLCEVPVSAHQFSRPLSSNDTSDDISIRSRSRKSRKSSAIGENYESENEEGRRDDIG